jgi:HNH endonuclease
MQQLQERQLFSVIIAIALAFLWFRVSYTGKVLRARKNCIKFKLRRAAVALCVYIICVVVLPVYGVRMMQALPCAIGAGAAMGLLVVQRPKHKRHIPRSVRAAVIKRDLGGHAFNRNLHSIDHIVPFSRGGDHSVHNLRVMERKGNLRKGGRMPTLDEFKSPLKTPLVGNLRPVVVLSLLLLLALYLLRHPSKAMLKAMPFHHYLLNNGSHIQYL